MVFDSLNKANIQTFYFAKNSGLEIDFIIPFKGVSTLIEVKTRNGNTKSNKTVMKHPEHYGKTKLIKIGLGFVIHLLITKKLTSFIKLTIKN